MKNLYKDPRYSEELADLKQKMEKLQRQYKNEEAIKLNDSGK
jgi:hypothetical protein